jgi:hypothetical protein
LILKDKAIKELDKSAAKTLVKEIIFNASLVFERLEFNGKIKANGYEMRQELAAIAAKKY